MRKNEQNKISAGNNDENSNVLMIDIMKYIRSVYSYRKSFLKIGIIGAICGLIIAFSIPKQYAVTVTLLPEMTGERGGGGLASMAASFLGGGSGRVGRDAVSPLHAPYITMSTPFLLEMLDMRVIHKERGIDTSLSNYMEQESAPWWSYILKVPLKLLKGIKSLWSDPVATSFSSADDDSTSIVKLSEKQLSKLYALRGKIMVTVNKKTSFISLSVMFQDPVITAVVAEGVVEKLQKYIINYKIKKAKEDCGYWEKLFEDSKVKYYEAQQKYADYVDANNNVISQRTMAERERLQNEMSLTYQVYTQVAQQLNMAQAKIQEAKPAFTVVEPAVVPHQSQTAGKLKMMIIFACFAVFGTLLWKLIGCVMVDKIKEAFEQSKITEE